MNLFTSDAIIEAYKNNDIEIGKDYIRVGNEKEEFGDLHLGAVQYVLRVLNSEYEGEETSPKTIKEYILDINAIRLDKVPRASKPYCVFINNSDRRYSYSTLEEAEEKINRLLKRAKRI